MIDQIYKCEHFAIHELVPPEIYNDRGEKAWESLDSRALVTLDQLRKAYGPITVNNWFWGKDRVASGLRIPGQKEYRPNSQHTFGRAFDCVFSKINPEIVRQEILRNQDMFPYIMSIELNTTTWLHFDVRNCDRIMTYNP
jgi:hypothetical protein